MGEGPNIHGTVFWPAERRPTDTPDGHGLNTAIDAKKSRVEFTWFIERKENDLNSVGHRIQLRNW